MFDLNKPSRIELMVAAAAGTAIGSVTSMKAEAEMSRLRYEDNKRRQDHAIKTCREAHNES